MVTFLRLPYMEVEYQTFNNNMIIFSLSTTFLENQIKQKE
ncbi:hypothetical protein GYO_0734 [Bacillus spizizenii TU-B-10]|uniref:Uncharacterized protein n=1 Tax=Bacillus spizizenii (strain DSM 15029 / JCM 12233 / NBRC 101239 / NRRL B-23049 / TU-B-10) TaxID=1052585 RepID=G4NW92_BACS4|nr:hypothetical protein GYO_0734 [Bacillus spizizenii TU-B-10]